MGKRVIRTDLSPKGISKALAELGAYRAEVLKRTNALVAALTDIGVEVAKAQVVSLGADYTGELMGSIKGYFNPATGIGIIKAGAWYAVFVEYGTGVVGMGSPHPEPEGWVYDINHHGQEGWTYFNDRDQRWYTTRGQGSRPFMYNTCRELERQCVRIAKEVFSA